MAKPGTMPTTTAAAPVAGVQHFGSKLVAAPKQRNNVLNMRVGPPKRTQAQVKPMKADTPFNVDNF